MKNTIIGYAEKTTKIVSAESKYLSYSKVLGVGTSIITTGYSFSRIIDQKNKGGLNEVFTHRDILDFSVNSVGLGALTLSYIFLNSNPLGWIVTGVMVYNGITVTHAILKP